LEGGSFVFGCPVGPQCKCSWERDAFEKSLDDSEEAYPFYSPYEAKIGVKAENIAVPPTP